MKKSLIKLYKKEIILFYLLAAVSLITASFADLKIDILLNNTASITANWFARTGDMPAYLLTVLAAAFAAKCARKKWLKALLIAACLCAGAYSGEWFAGRMFAPDSFQKIFGCVFGVCTALAVLLVLHFITIDADTKKPLFIIAVVALGVFVLQAGLVEIMKTLWGRARFWELDPDYSQFTDWYIINGNNGLYSFPSGHTAGAGMCYLVMLLPAVSEKCTKHKTLLFAAAVVYTSVVALTRLMMGAHFLSDVTFGGVISFSCTLLGALVFEKFERRLEKQAGYERIMEKEL